MRRMRNEEILEKAYEVFLWNGYKKTTMSDLAKGIRISRQGLYQKYVNKEEVYRAVVNLYFNRVHQRGKELVKRGEGGEEKLKWLMVSWVEETFRGVSKSEQRVEIYETGYTVVKDIKKRFDQIYMKEIEGLLSEHSMVSEEKIKRMAKLFAFTSLGLRREAQSLTELRQLLEDLRSLLKWE